MKYKQSIKERTCNASLARNMNYQRNFNAGNSAMKEKVKHWGKVVIIGVLN